MYACMEHAYGLVYVIAHGLHTQDIVSYTRHCVASTNVYLDNPCVDEKSYWGMRVCVYTYTCIYFYIHILVHIYIYIYIYIHDVLLFT
jgi:hypothetical protein